MDYFRKSTHTSPTIIMDSRFKSVLIKGDSLCNDSPLFSEVTNEIKKQLANGDYFNLNFKFRVFNAWTAKSLLEMLKDLRAKKPSMIVNWLYEKQDEEMREMGLDYSELLEMDFNFVTN
ncbi:SiaC family regulatory phosphoprotein [Ekhidna sp.]|uniref:SiaC family regulatory phosphoprotein n=1 Tax=Ekhidna sp. TaxID=2608089 RepID=UPI003516EE6A